MVNTSETVTRTNISYADECPYLTDEDEEARNSRYSKSEQYNWDARTQGLIMSSFFYAYFVTVLTGGYIAKKFGAKRVFGGGVFLTSVLTLLTPAAVRWGTIPFIVARALEGIGEGLTYPSMNTMVSRWAPKLERSRISSAVFSGCPLGTVVSLSVSGWLCGLDFLGGWPAVFYVFGTAGCIWSVLWFIIIYDSPDIHPDISEEELSLYYQTEDNKVSHMDFDVPWKKILTSVPMLGLLIGHIGIVFGLIILMTEIPNYLNAVLHFGVEASGFVTGLPNILEAFGGVCASYFADKMISSKRFSVTVVRKIFNSIGILFGLTNGIASLTGIIAPNMVGAFTASGGTRTNWNKVFYVTAGIYFIASTIFNLLVSAELQDWNTKKVSEEKSKTVETKS
ncbi:hypothetical protein TNIN_499561 [Trichonephila inaurata madagascariensis]|uniref:Major facilitator superfamily (MFS) profile domain-containing protein n=1 Tax=Trichonephila inaurata madagascariensis TaxID=2747483 RepID=A0A8X7CIG2_9ARAC|nr:hypothetical protein TNIN_499561 [Trichonephila inaurata madagascariensis]